MTAASYVRNVNEADLQEVVRRLLERTVRHFASSLNQDVYALDDLATVLRALIRSSRGNNALVALCSRLQITEPTIPISGEADQGHGIAFCFGAMPTKGSVAERIVSFSRLQTSWVLEVKAYLSLARPGGAACGAQSASRDACLHARVHGHSLGRSSGASCRIDRRRWLAAVHPRECFCTG